MNWYYAEGEKQRGPVTEADLDNLFKAGTIQTDTLVWREGLANWEPFSSIRKLTLASAPPITAPPPMAALPPSSGGSGAAYTPGVSDVVCTECHQMFPMDETIRYGDSYVCANCKPIFVQKMKEGAIIGGGVEYAGFGIRFGAKFLDGIILRLVGAATDVLFGLIFSKGDSGALVVISIGIGVAINAAYNTFFIGKFGATPGKMAAKIRVVNADGSEVGYPKACARYFAELLSVLTLMIV
jgi:hypothetical protein